MSWISMEILFRMGPFCSGRRGRNRPRHLLALLGPTDLPNAVKNYENYYFINTNFTKRLTYKRRGPRGEHRRCTTTRYHAVAS